jgi:hypothetical protein
VIVQVQHPIVLPLLVVTYVCHDERELPVVAWGLVGIVPQHWGKNLVVGC